jgi:hypothetical protein
MVLPTNTVNPGFGRRILLAVIGLTPQVVTETLHALIHRDPSRAARPLEGRDGPGRPAHRLGQTSVNE